MSTIPSSLVGGIHVVTPTEIEDLQKVAQAPRGIPMPLDPDGGRRYAPVFFDWSRDQTISVLKPNEAQVEELRRSPELYGQFLAHAVEVNKAYFIPDEKPPAGTVEHRQYSSRVDAFTREAIDLAKHIYAPGAERDAAFNAIDREGRNLALAVHQTLGWGDIIPTRNERMKQILGDAKFAGYDEEPLWKPRGEGFGASADFIFMGAGHAAGTSRANAVILDGDHVPTGKMIIVGVDGVEWGHHPKGGVGKKGEE
jgi:hypothetical protein